VPTSKKSPRKKSPSRNARRVRANGHPAGPRVAPKRTRKATPGDWIAGARLRTLPLAIAPVALGTGAATLPGNVLGQWPLVLLCLAVALFLQIGVNYANDYSDGIRGTDDYRTGPARLTGSGAVRPRVVLTVALVFFGLAAAAGIAIVIITQIWWLLAVGAVAIVAAWFYTGGKRPYGYSGLGELFVFVFFGLVATLGTMWVLVREITFEGVLAAVAIGFISCAVLMANNIRDIPQDRVAGKKTLAVRVGNLPARILYCVFMLVPYLVLGFLALVFPKALLVFFTLLLALPAALIVVTAKTPKELILALQLTSFTGLLYGLGLAAALAF
jgi:1,4-dihydroxy-2-naphthoate octaprenyltransferase